MKTELTIEESTKLIEFGVDRKLASMKVFVPIHPEVLKGNAEYAKHWGWFPKFRLEDIISILPKEINDGVTTFHLNIDYPMPNHVSARYVDPDDVDNDVLGVMCNELIDTLNALLKRTIKSGYIILNSNKK